MKLIHDFSKMDTERLFKILRSFKRPLIGLPLVFGVVPLVPLVRRFPEKLWWMIPLYGIGILFVSGMIATAYGRLIEEIEKRIKTVSNKNLQPIPSSPVDEVNTQDTEPTEV